MSTAILILSPYPEARTTKAVQLCQRRAQNLGLVAPAMEVFPEHPARENLDLLLDPEDLALIEAVEATESVIALEGEVSLAKDPCFVECFRFLLRRSGEALVQFPEGIAEPDIGMAVVASLEGIEDFDEREEARKVHARLQQSKYRILAQRWKRGDANYTPRPVTNHDMEQQELSWRLSFPPEFRAYLTIIGFGPGPAGAASSGIVPFDEMENPKTLAQTTKRPKLGKTIVVGRIDEKSHHLLVCEGEARGTVWTSKGGKLGHQPLAESFIEYIEAWVGAGEVALFPCTSCGGLLELEDLEKQFCSGCGARPEGESDRSEASEAFESLSKALLLKLLEDEFLEIEDPGLLRPLIAALTEYMSEKGHKWRSPDKAAASIAGWLLHRDEVAELHGTNSDVARAFEAVGRS